MNGLSFSNEIYITLLKDFYAMLYRGFKWALILHPYDETFWTPNKISYPMSTMGCCYETHEIIYIQQIILLDLVFLNN